MFNLLYDTHDGVGYDRRYSRDGKAAAFARFDDKCASLPLTTLVARVVDMRDRDHCVIDTSNIKALGSLPPPPPPVRLFRQIPPIAPADT